MPSDERNEFGEATCWHYRNGPLASLWYAHSKATIPNRAAVRHLDNLLAQAE